MQDSILERIKMSIIIINVFQLDFNQPYDPDNISETIK